MSTPSGRRQALQILTCRGVSQRKACGYGRNPTVNKFEQFALDVPITVGACDGHRPHAIFGSYIVGRLVVEMVYYPDGAPLVRLLLGMWHPNNFSKVIKFRALHGAAEELERAAAEARSK